MSPFHHRLRQLALLGGYVLAFLLCVGGSGLSLGLLVFPAGRRREWWGRWVVHAISWCEVEYLRATGVVGSDLSTLAPLRSAHGVIIAANHPAMLDAIMLFAALPQTFCLVKGAILRNPLLALLARAAGFVSNEAPAGLLDECVTRLGRGETLIIFPEGTRTVKDPLDPLQPGFALIARRAGVPVQTVLVGSDRLFVGKRGPFFNLDHSFPIRYDLTVGDRFEPGAFHKAKEMSAAIESYLRAALTR